MFPATPPFHLWLPSIKTMIQQQNMTVQDALMQFMKNVHPSCLHAYKNAPAGRHSLYKDEGSEVALWKWTPGHVIPMHPHTGKLCVWRVIEGCITEIRPEQSERVYCKDDIGYIADKGMHEVWNTSDDNESGLTLHFYPIMNQFS